VTEQSAAPRKFWLLASLLTIGTVWGLVPSLAKLVTLEGASALGATFWQSLGGGLLLYVITLVRGRRLHLSKHHVIFYLVCGTTGTSLPTLIIFLAAGEISAGLISIIIALTPIITYGLALAYRIEVLIPVRVVGIVLGFIAVLMITLPGVDSSSALATLWIVAMLIVPFSYSAENLIITLKRPPHGDGISLVAGMLLSSAVVLFPIALFSDALAPAAMASLPAQMAVVGIVLANTLSYVLFLFLVTHAGPVYAAQCGYLNMVIGVLWGIVIWNETHSMWVWAAVVVLAGGMFLVKEQSEAARRELASTTTKR